MKGLLLKKCSSETFFVNDIMHEFSLAQGLHGQLLNLVREHAMERVRSAEVCIGENAGIVVESFLFGVNVLIEQNDQTQGMKLRVVEDYGSDLILIRVQLE
jgi:hydrogenase nickel incorporation protein HypA/HybF